VGNLIANFMVSLSLLYCYKLVPFCKVFMYVKQTGSGLENREDGRGDQLR
jgi:hypothetical protein